jgi:hypothetical protein
MYNKIKSQDIIAIIKLCTLEWLGHAVRRNGVRVIKIHWKTRRSFRKGKT